VKKIKPDGSKTIYVGGIYEVDKTSSGTVTRTVTYYPVAGAMRINSTLYYILKDHLDSASVVTDASGNILGEQRYYPFGETRLTTGTIYTDKLFTGQREMAGLGIYHFNARFYSPKLGRFLSADSIVPSYANPQSLNRMSYVTNNPLRYTDPTGHKACGDGEAHDCDGYLNNPSNNTNVGCGGPGQQSCGGVPGNDGGDDDEPEDIPGQCDRPHCYDEREVAEPLPFLPDYFALEGGIPTNFWIIGVDFVLTIDKYGRVYFGAGPSGGTSPALGLDVNVSASVGYIQDSNTSPDEAHSFISEWSGGGCIGAGPGYCRVTGDPFDGANTWANQYGLFTPQAGVALPFSGQFFPILK